MFTLGLSKLRRDKPEEAREWLSKSVGVNGQRPEVWLALGQAHLRLKNAGLAERAFQTALRLGHGAAPIYLGVGTAYQGQGNYEKAVPAFEHAVAVAGTDPAPRIALVRAIIKAGQKDRAAKLIDSWRGERMGSPSLHAELGIALAEAQLYSQAIREFETGLEEAPGSYDLQYNLALAYFYQERYDDCVTIARSLLQQTDNDQLHHLLGLVFERASQISAAAEEFRKAIALNPRVDDYYFHLGRLALQSGNYAEAERNFLAGRTVCVTRACVENLIGLGTAYSFEGKIGLAATTLEQAIQQDPRDYIPYVYLGDVLIKAGKFSKAEGPLKRALELKPDSGLAHYMYAYGLLKGNPQRVSDATASLREAIRLDPQNPLAYYRLGLIHSRAKEYSQAAALLEKAVALDTHLKEAHYQLGLAYQKLCKIELAGSEFRIIQALREKSLQAEELERREIVRELNRLSSQ